MRYIVEFDSPAELAAFTAGQSTGPAPATPVAVRNNRPQSITLTGALEVLDGREVLVISLGPRPDPSETEVPANRVDLAPGETSMVAS